MAVITLLTPVFANCQGLLPGATEIWEPVPEIVEPGNGTIERPSDAIVLFDGTSFDEWETNNGSDVEWELENGAMTVVGGAGSIFTRREFEDIQLHIEWRSPVEIEGEGQGRGNSGIFLQNRYEVQVLDNWENATYVNGMAGSIYKQHVPLANPAKRPGEWQTYDILYRAPDFDADGEVVVPARVTVILNGVLVQNNVEIYGPTVYTGYPEYEAHGADRISLQDHSNPVSYRNIWVRELDTEIMGTYGVDGSSD